ncbi:Putative zinc ribbon domain protein [Corynebacterium ciconiae DSM 44920]|uniref:C4-type zinc ribbon domain-containing protein n=1 Tax=Corynebacterium ciconiae TaxID=227319 RepID=UPI000373A302|nr:C4-type zinc ribbon domain-containing protein [Corynebacterium ciconiae]WKD60708.1 Putative zinc ribbon domain protein [Corynebacterium ciconiae DSM 44920]
MRLAAHLQPMLAELARRERVGAGALKKEEQAERDTLEALLAERAEERNARAASQMSTEDQRWAVSRIEADMRKLTRREKANVQALGATTDPEVRRDLEHDLRSTRSKLKEQQKLLREAERKVSAAEMNTMATGAESDELDRKIETAERAVAAAQHATEAAEASNNERVAEIRAELPEEAVRLYDTSSSAFGAAFFNGRTCGGCSIILPAAQASAIMSAPADSVPTCPECGTYLVRERG